MSDFHTYQLKRIPKDVWEIILEEQKRIKEEIGINQITYEHTILRIIRDFKKCQDGEFGNLNVSTK